MKTSSRRIVVGIAVVALGLAVAGCGGADPTNAAAAPPPVAAQASPPTVTPAATADVTTAGDIPDNQIYVPFSPAGVPATVSVPQGWAQTTEGNDAVFTDKYNSVHVRTEPRPTPADVQSVRATDLPKLQAATPGFVLKDIRTVQRSAGTAVLMTYTATSPASPVTGRSVVEAVEQYIFWRDGQSVVLTLSGPDGADNVDPWRTITNSFRWQR